MNKNKILIKKITSSLNDKEEVLFQEWLNKSESNKLLYDKLLLIRKERNSIKSISEIDTKKAWQLVLDKADSNKLNSSSKLFANKKLNYFIAASVIILISVGFIYSNRILETPVQSTPIIVDNNISSGTNKAILTLEDGTSVELKENAVYKTPKVNSDGKQIVYSKSEKTNEEPEYNFLTIPRGGQFSITLSDETKVWLNSETKIKYPITFVQGAERSIELIYGEAFFDVSSSSNHGGSVFKVYHNYQEVEVIGTQFNIKAYKEERNIYTTLIEGKVTITANSIKQNLEPNQQSNLDLDTKSLLVSTIDVKPEISWKDGVFNFDSKKLIDIMVVLSRWYDMDVVFEKKELQEEKFSGLINKNYGIQDILTVMKDTDIINSYSIHEKTLTIK